MERDLEYYTKAILRVFGYYDSFENFKKSSNENDSILLSDLDRLARLMKSEADNLVINNTFIQIEQFESLSSALSESKRRIEELEKLNCKALAHILELQKKTI
jgi:hypothetical protein